MIRPGRAALQAVSSRLTLALRVALLTTIAVGVTLAAVSGIIYFSVRTQLEHSLDQSLLRRANAAVASGVNLDLVRNYRQVSAVFDMKIGYVAGGVVLDPDRLAGGIPSSSISQDELLVSMGARKTSARTGTIGGEPYRFVAVSAGSGQALVLAQSLEPAHRTLERVAVVLWLTSAAGIAAAGLFGWVVATNGIRPVRRLTDAAERVARTQELTPIAVTGHDELARLTTSFNAMLVALDASQERQRQLVADAGHELRTPLTSLRTNIELLGQATENPERVLSPTQVTEIMDDVKAQLSELSTLVGDLVELARDEPLRRDPTPGDLTEIVEHSVERVRRRAPGLTFDVQLQPWWVVGEPAILERAVTNLLDNAAKWTGAEGTVRVRLADGVLTVADEGPGIAAKDLPHVFDRFYRASEARTLPGSGLGLSIVYQAVVRHGGTVEAASTPGEGATFTMTLPGSPDGPPPVLASEGASTAL